ncbi:MAG: T9SS type A sorting domain-containing protein [Candidatus Cloacimonetes bacterium]|nr:T9SS type A sorting domain-containing protein [Candidatus Cloacimonadota bacterium]
MKRVAAMLALVAVCLPLLAMPDFAAIVQRQHEVREAERQAYIRWMENAPTTTRQMDDYDVRYYKIVIALAFDEEWVQADNTIRVEVTAAALDSLHLHFAHILTVDGVTMGAQPLDWTHTDGILAIDLGQSYSQGEMVEVQVQYSGFPDPDRLEDGLKFESHSPQGGETVAFTMVSPRGARKWWPCKDSPADKPDSLDIWVRHQYMYTCVANGALVEIEDNGDSTVTSKWHESYPIATYLTSFACTNYEVFSFDWTYNDQTIPVDNYYYPEQEEVSIALYGTCEDMLTFFSDTYGEYPFMNEKYGHATCTNLGALAMEHQTCTSFDAGYINDEAAVYTVAHELGHSWAGNSLTISSWSDVWLKEGFAVYSEALWAEHNFGSQALFDYMDAEDSGSALDEPLYRDPDGTASHIFNSVVYRKGGWTVHMLRYVMGDDAFFDFLPAYFSDPDLRYGNTDMQALENVAEAVHGSQLDWFFDQWFYQEGRPRYEYALYVMDPALPPVVAINSLPYSGETFDMYLPYTYMDYEGRLFVPGGMNHLLLPIPGTSLSIDWDSQGWVLDGGFTEKRPVLEQIPTRDGSVGLVWQPYFDDAIDGFCIYRSQDEGQWEYVATAPVNSTGWLDEGLDPASTYRYFIEVVYDGVYRGAPSNVIEATPIEYTLDEGVLIVDNSADFTTPGFPTDEEMDAFYIAVLASLQPAMWDVATQGEPPLTELARYSTVVWHADDILQGDLADCYYNLQNYLLAGGNMLISQSRKLSQMDADMLRETFGVESMEFCNSPEFTGALGEGWPDIAVDPDKIPLTTWGDNLAQVYTFEPYDDAVALYRFDSASGEPPWQDEPCAIIGGGGNSGYLLLLGFPLYYLEEEDVTAFMFRAMIDFGELATDEDVVTPPALALSARPNPFNPRTILEFSLPESARVELNIYDVRGRCVLRRDLGYRYKGAQTWTWDAGGSASGVYLLRLQAGGASVVRKVVLLK